MTGDSGFDAYLFGQNKTSDTIVISIVGFGSIPFPDNQIQSAGAQFAYADTFQLNQFGIYLITYDIKTSESFTDTTLVGLLQESHFFRPLNYYVTGSTIQAPHGYNTGLISLNRTFLFSYAYNSDLSNLSNILIQDSSVSSLTILGGINCPQISIVQIG